MEGDVILGFDDFELIDTQWNVNYLVDDGTGWVNGELIDTQWNVNVLISERIVDMNGINRYIVECK